MIKILHILNKFNGGGIEAVVMNYYKNINRSECQFDFICNENSLYIPEEEINELGGKVYKLPSFFHVFEYIQAVKEIAKNYDIVHCHMGPLAFIPLLACKLAGCEVRIVHCHTTINSNTPVKKLISNVCKPLSKTLATEHIACSDYVGKWMYGKSKYIVLNNAIDTKKYNFDNKLRDTKRKELGIKHDEILIGHVGRFEKQKNHEFLINVFKALCEENLNNKMLLIGDGTTRPKIKQMVKEYNLEDKVIFLGQINNVEDYYSAMDVFMLPSLHEGLPVVAVEAQTRMLKCFFSDVISNEVIMLNASELLPLDKDVWVKKITDWCHCPFTIHYTNAIGNYDIKENAKKLENIYRKLV